MFLLGTNYGVALVGLMYVLLYSNKLWIIHFLFLDQGSDIYDM